MQEGSFYCFVPKSPSVPGWLLTRTKSAKLVHKKLDGVLNSWEDSSPLNDASGSCELSRSGSIGSVPSTQSWVFPGGGLTVKLGLYEVASELYRVHPYVYNTPDNSAVICFSGYLSNLQELARGYSGSRSPKSPVAKMVNEAYSLERKSSIERSMDVGALTASVVLELYQNQKEGEELIMLSELQGQYAFVIYDNHRKQAFAARDPSGSETLFYHVSDDGAISFASSRLSVPEGERSEDWRELPPGHYISGKHPRMHQFALTPEQLQVREARDSFGGSSSEGLFRSLSLGAGGAGAAELDAAGGGIGELLGVNLQSRSSMDNNRLVKHKSLDLDVFSLDL